MNSNIKVELGKRIIESGRVYQIFKINKKKENGKPQKIIHYKPVFRIEEKHSLICSIPVCNLKEAKIRMPTPRREMSKLLKSLNRKRQYTKPVDPINAKTILNQNDVYQTIKILKRYWNEKNIDIENFSKSKQNVIDLAVDYLFEEVAQVFRISPKSAKEKILQALEN